MTADYSAPLSPSLFTRSTLFNPLESPIPREIVNLRLPSPVSLVFGLMDATRIPAHTRFILRHPMLHPSTSAYLIGIAITTVSITGLTQLPMLSPMSMER